MGVLLSTGETHEAKETNRMWNRLGPHFSEPAVKGRAETMREPSILAVSQVINIKGLLLLLQGVMRMWWICRKIPRFRDPPEAHTDEATQAWDLLENAWKQTTKWQRQGPQTWHRTDNCWIHMVGPGNACYRSPYSCVFETVSDKVTELRSKEAQSPHTVLSTEAPCSQWRGQGQPRLRWPSSHSCFPRTSWIHSFQFYQQRGEINHFSANWSETRASCCCSVTGSIFP